MITISKSKNNKQEVAILVVNNGAFSIEHQLNTIKGRQVIEINKRYYIPYTKQAYNQFLALNLPFRTLSSTSGDHSHFTDNTSNDNSQNSEYFVWSDGQRADIAKANIKSDRLLQIEYISNKFCLAFPYDKTIVVWVKELQSAYWNPKYKQWHAKGTIANLNAIQNKFDYFSTTQYQDLVKLIECQQGVLRIEIWRSPQYKDAVFIKATGQSLNIEPIKAIPERVYEKAYKRWRIPYNANIIDKLISYYQSRGVNIIYRLAENGHTYNKSKINYNFLLSKLLDRISEDKHSWAKQYAEIMIAQRYSQSSIKQYIGKFLKFLDYFAHRAPDKLLPLDVNKYITRLSKQEISDHGLNIAISAIKFFYTKVIYNPAFEIERIRRPRKGRYLPTILSQQEISRMFASCSNVKHSSILFTLYSSGIRLNEILNIKLIDVFWDRNQIFIRSGKGKKDRVVQLSHTLKQVLELYFDEYKPIYWLYEGADQRSQYSSSSVQKVVRAAAKKAGIQRKVTPHTLRHCYATHLHDGGTSIRYIQELLGHKDIKTTLIYTHVSTREICNVVSPLDQLYSKYDKKRNEIK